MFEPRRGVTMRSGTSQELMNEDNVKKIKESNLRFQFVPSS